MLNRLWADLALLLMNRKSTLMLYIAEEEWLKPQ